MTTEHIRQLIDQEIAIVTANIERMKGVGVYVENCDRWRIQLEAYHKMREMIDRTMVEQAETDVAPP